MLKIFNITKHNQNGFSLLEVALSIAILGAVTSSLFFGLSGAFRSNALVDSHSTALALAQNQAESIEGQNYITALADSASSYNLTSTPIPSGYSICSKNRAGDTVTSILGVPWNTVTDIAISSDTGIQKVIIVIKQGEKEVFTLAMYKVRA